MRGKHVKAAVVFLFPSFFACPRVAKDARDLPSVFVPQRCPLEVCPQDLWIFAAPSRPGIAA